MVKIYVQGGTKNKDIFSGVYCNYKDININFSERVGCGSIKIAQELAICNAIEIIKSLGINEKMKIYSSNKKLVKIINSSTIKDKHLKKYPMVNEISRFAKSNSIEVEYISSRKNEAKSLIKQARRGVLYNEVGIVDFRSFETKKGKLMKVIFNGPSSGVIKYEEVIA